MMLNRTIKCLMGAGALVIATALSAQEDNMSKYREINLQAQPLSEALTLVADEFGLQIGFFSEIADGTNSPELTGRYTADQVFATLLKNTGLKYTYSGDSLVAIQGDRSSSSSQSRRSENDKENNLRNKMIEEVVVTANKREQSIQDVPLSISAFGKDEIEKKNLVDMDDYLRTMPGVNMIDMGAGRNAIFVRGVAADPQFEDRTVGVYFGEIPVSVLSMEGGAADFKMVDIQRVEVLRGPQGTLYGSGSMGGTVRVIPNSPNLSELEGSVEGMFSNTGKRGGNNGMAQGVINIPVVEDVFAIRAVAYQYENSGYVDNIATSAKAAVGEATGAVFVEQDEVGSDTTTGFRASALWQINEDLDVTYSYATQEVDADGRHGVNLTLDDYQQARFSTPYGNEFLLDDVETHNIVIKYDLSWGSLQSSSSWVQYEGLTNRNFLGTFWEAIPVSSHHGTDNKSFVEEIRLTSSLDGPVQFVAGLYYEKLEKWFFSSNNWGGDPALSESFGFGVNSTALGEIYIDEVIKQKAIFSEISYAITEQLGLTIGGRFYEYDRESSTTSDGESFFTLGFEDQYIQADNSGDSLKVNLSYSPNEDKMFYVQWSEGFRLGKPLPPPPSFCDVDSDGIHDDLGIPFPSQLDSDFLENFEVGSKLSFADGRLSVNASVYHIKWDGIPIQVGVFSPCGTGVQLNAGSASSQGFELESTWYATESLRMDVGASYISTELGVDVPGGNKGDRLPGSPEYNFNIGVQYDFDLAERQAYIRSDYAYVGGFYNNFPQVGAAAGDYSQVNVKAGMNLDKAHIALFINNLLDEDALTWVDAFPPTAHQMRPRTVGFNVGYRF